MHPFNQTKATPGIALQMSVVLCDKCPGSPSCKRYMQWLRLNTVNEENSKSYLDFEEMPAVDRPYYRSRGEEVFW
jgi:hypothetical protein